MNIVAEQRAKEKKSNQEANSEHRICCGVLWCARTLCVSHDSLIQMVFIATMKHDTDAVMHSMQVQTYANTSCQLPTIVYSVTAEDMACHCMALYSMHICTNCKTIFCCLHGRSSSACTRTERNMNANWSNSSSGSDDGGTTETATTLHKIKHICLMI